MLFYREACSIESAALSNPNRKIFILLLTPYASDNLLEFPIIHSLRHYDNIFFRTIDLDRFSKGTPAEEWIASNVLIESKYFHTQALDLLKFLM